MNLISIEKLEKNINDRTLFSDVTLGIDDNDKIGFIGPNGAGKSTFMRIIANQIKHDDGDINYNNSLKIGFLEQLPHLNPELTAPQQLFEIDGPLIKLYKEYKDTIKRIENEPELQSKLDELSHLMDVENGWDLEARYQSLLIELGISDFEMKAVNFSGGMKKKCMLAAVLSSGANLLLLDEPTNHLDIETIEWLENYLKQGKFSFLMVTHDRYFLDSVCNTIFELDNQTIYKYVGPYSMAVEKKQERLEHEKRSQNRINAILKRELKWLQRGPRARAGKDKKRVEKVANLMDSKEAETQKMSEFSSGNRRLGKKIVEFYSVEKCFSDNTVVAPFSYSFKRGERIGIIGPNGSGKSTLLNLITNRIEQDNGRIERGVNTHFGYFDQMAEKMDDDMTILDYIKSKAERITMPDESTISATAFLEMFLFPSSMHRQPIKNLSGGERRRLYLIRILTTSPNFLLLDEPTNDLDLDTLNLLEEYLEKFEGCVIIVSHDRAFLDRTTDYLFIFKDDGKISGFAGNYSELKDSQKEYSQEKLKDKVLKVKTKKEKKISYQEKKELDSLLPSIEKLEIEKSELEDGFGFETDNNKLHEMNKRYNEINMKIEEYELRWEYLASLPE